MTKFTMVASIAVFLLGAVIGRVTAPMAVMASEAKLISIDELTRKTGPLPVESFDAV
jgi:hypothetical protein